MKAPVAALALLALAAAPAQAQLFKCVQGGKTVYQDAPCDEKAQQSTVRAPAAPSQPAPAAAPARPGPGAAAPAAAAPTGGNAIEIVAGFTVCAERVPNFARKYTDAFEGWKMRNAESVSRLANEPEASQLDARLRQERDRPASESIAEKCADVATTIQPPADRGAPRVAQ